MQAGMASILIWEWGQKILMHVLEKAVQSSDNIIIRKIFDFLKPFAG
jgi:hypothetical protein